MSIFQGRRARPWQLPPGTKSSFTADGYYLGTGSGTPVEVAVAKSSTRPTESDIRNLWKKRRGGTPSPLLLVVTWPDGGTTRASVCGTTGDDPAVYSDRDLGQITRLAEVALAEPDHHAAVRFLSAYLPEERGGIRNVALFASNHLTSRVPQRPDWRELCQKGERLLALRRQQLIEALGFTLEPKGNAALLRTAGQASALAVFLDDNENPDATNSRFNGITPVSWAIASATADNIPYVVVTRGPQVRIYTTRSGAGITGKGGTAAFLELNLPLLSSQDAGYLPLLFSAESLAPGGVFEQLLEETNDFAVDLGSRLRSRVYDFTVPVLAQALIDEHHGDTDPDSLESLYRQSLLVLFRLLFVAYAEDRDLLPLRTNGLYRQRSLKHTARELSDLANQHGWDDIPFDENATDLWDGVGTLWTAVDKGRREWSVPAYNGGMFSSEPEVSEDGAALVGLSLTNAAFGPALLGLLVDETDDGRYLPVDFASLDVREFGTIYEGLLQSNLAVAPSDLTRDKDDVYVPAGPRDTVYVAEGAIYLHNRSGARKASGSYFTKPFAVNHLLNHALDPALDSHLSRLRGMVEDGDQIGASEAFFDFRCVDLAMGSGHFLVAAVDRIERRLSEFLTEHRLPGVLDELDRLSSRAAETLEASGVPAEGTDTNALLRRQIARRCIYGVDLNPVSVELARLALWIHTFVKGLPLTSLNHGLIVGNSLTGIGRLDEAVDVLDPDAKAQHSFVREAIYEALEGAQTALSRFAATSEADAREVREAREAHREAAAAVAPAQLLLDYAIAIRTGKAKAPAAAFAVDELLKAATASRASDLVASLAPVHFPVAFPEVFLRDRPGFDCILGNPPWETVKVETHKWWALRFPGLGSMPTGERDKRITSLRGQRPDLQAEYETDVEVADVLRAAIHSLPYPGLGTGDVDLYEVFAWRMLDILREAGWGGVVFPRSLLASGGTSEWRRRVLDSGSLVDATLLLNNRKWVFDEVHPQYTIALVTLCRDSAQTSFNMSGPHPSLAAYERRDESLAIPSLAPLGWTPTATIPLVPTSGVAAVLLKTYTTGAGLLNPRHPWQVRTYNEMHSTREKPLMKMSGEPDPGMWSVYKGESIQTWQPDTGRYYGWADPKRVFRDFLMARRPRQSRTSTSAFFGMKEDWVNDSATLPCNFARVAWRKIARTTDTRTVHVALIPPRVFVADHCYLLFFPSPQVGDDAFILGCMASLPFDWIARRVVEVNLTAEIMTALPLPVVERGAPFRDRVIEIAARLAAVDDRYTDWATEVGVPVGSVKTDTEKTDLIHELDAAVALLYGLDADDVQVIFETFHEGWAYQERLAGVLKHMDRLSGDAS